MLFRSVSQSRYLVLCAVMVGFVFDVLVLVGVVVFGLWCGYVGCVLLIVMVLVYVLFMFGVWLCLELCVVMVGFVFDVLGLFVLLVISVLFIVVVVVIVVWLWWCLVCGVGMWVVFCRVEGWLFEVKVVVLDGGWVFCVWIIQAGMLKNGCCYIELVLVLPVL